MKTFLRIFCVALLAAIFPFNAVLAQTMMEPTINSTLDNIEIIKVNTDQVFDLFIEAGDRAGEPVKIRMVLDNPAQRQLITLAANFDAVTPNFVAAEFGADGIAILGNADENIDLKNMQVYVRINIAQEGTYKYKFDLLRGDNNVIASVSEEVVVAGTVPASIRSTLNQNPNLVKGTNTDFYMELKQGEVAVNTPVRIRMTLNNKAQAQRLTLQAQDGQNYAPVAFNADGVAIYGPAAGFTLADQRVNFRANFSDAALYEYKLEVINASDNTVLATRNETAAVNNVAGISENIGDERVRVYPTLAASGYVVLEMGNVQQAQVLVHDALGRTVMTADNLSGSHRISTAGFSKGMYFIKVIKDAEVAGGRFIVQ
jgi:hypothetical protein